MTTEAIRRPSHPSRHQVMGGPHSRAIGPRLLLCGFETAQGAAPDIAGLIIHDFVRCRWMPHSMDIDPVLLPVRTDLALDRVKARLSGGKIKGVLIAGLGTEDSGFELVAGAGPEAGDLAEKIAGAVEEEDLPCGRWGRASGAAAALWEAVRAEQPDLPVVCLFAPQASEFGGQYPLRRLQRGLQAAVVAFVSWMSARETGVQRNLRRR